MIKVSNIFDENGPVQSLSDFISDVVADNSKRKFSHNHKEIANHGYTGHQNNKQGDFIFNNIFSSVLTTIWIKFCKDIYLEWSRQNSHELTHEKTC